MGTKCFQVVLTRELGILVIVIGGGATRFTLGKRGGEGALGLRNKLRTQIFLFCRSFKFSACIHGI